jgi:hypothetical protein
MYEGQAAGETAVVPVENGYIMSRLKLQNYVEVKDESWNAEANGKSIQSTSQLSRLKSFFADFMQLKGHAQDAKDKGIADEEIRKLRMRRENSLRLGQELQAALNNSEYSQMKVCSESTSTLEGNFENQPFKISIVSSKSEPFTQTTSMTTSIADKELKLEETEGFVQTGAFRLAVYQSTRTSLSRGSSFKSSAVGAATATPEYSSFTREFAKSLKGPKSAKLVVDKAARSPSSSAEAVLKSTWHLAKKVASCCADHTCREALRSKTNSQNKGGLLPYESQHGAR